MSTGDVGLQKKILDEALGVIGRYRSFKNPPHIAREIHRIIKDRTGVFDPYERVKKRDLDLALGLYPKIKQYVEGAEDSCLYRALKAAAIGNALDSGVGIRCNIGGGLEEELAKPFVLSDVPLFRERLDTAKTLLIIGDNTGETVFDRLLLEQLPGFEIAYAVRSAPIINDATMKDALASGLDRHARIISSGCDSPGVLLDECTGEFLDIFYGSDIVISKGQGNFETLSGEKLERDVFFLLKVKCPVVSKIIDVDSNEYVFKYGRGE